MVNHREKYCMKRIILFAAITLLTNGAFSQDCCDRNDQNVLKLDSLKRYVIKPLNDSISKLHSARETEIIKLNERIHKLETIKNDLTQTVKNFEANIAALNKDKIKLERDNLISKNAELNNLLIILNDSLSLKDSIIRAEKKNGEEKSNQSREEGKQETVNRIVQTYNKPFEELIKNSTLKTVERDYLIIGNSSEAQRKLSSLRTYFDSEQIIYSKYNEETVKKALVQLAGLEQNELVIKLIDKLNNYYYSTEGLKTAIKKIDEKDKIFLAADEDMQEKKLEKILTVLAGYFRNYQFNFTAYPYLSDVVLELIKLKQKDANTDVSKLLDRL